MSYQEIIAVGSGGFVGAVCRYMLSQAMSQRGYLQAFPLATLSVNIIGGFLMGLVMALFVHSFFDSHPLKLFLTTGLLGGFTTYSAFAYESFVLLGSSHFMLASLSIALNAFGSIIAVAGGFALSTALLARFS